MTLHQYLREATKGAHRELDHHPLLASLVRDGLSREHYGNALAGLYGVYDPLEAQLYALIQQKGLDFSHAGRFRLPALRADLAALGRSPITTAISFPPATAVPQLVGMLYTLEGSAMGGQAIARYIVSQQSSTSGARLPTRFFSGDGEAGSERWQAFWTFADASCRQDDFEAAASAAVELFRKIKHQLDAAQLVLYGAE
jgi:heme oxygenase